MLIQDMDTNVAKDIFECWYWMDMNVEDGYECLLVQDVYECLRGWI